MATKNWKCLRIFAESFEEMNRVNVDILRLMKELKPEHVETYFFNRYFNSKKKEFFINLGLVNNDKKATDDLDNLLKNHKVTVKSYDCEMWEVNGFPIDFIKCVSCEIFEKIRESFGDKPLTRDQLFYLLHFVMNQLGWGYERELDLYTTLAQNIEAKLKKS